MASVRTRYWRNRKGQKLTAYVVDYRDLDGKRRLQTFNTEAAALIFREALIEALRREDAKPPAPEPIAEATAPQSSSPKSDLLMGSQVIADFLGWTPRRVYYAAEKQTLPIFRVGTKLTARRSELDKALSALNTAA